VAIDAWEVTRSRSAPGGAAKGDESTGIQEPAFRAPTVREGSPPGPDRRHGLHNRTGDILYTFHGD